MPRLARAAIGSLAQLLTEACLLALLGTPAGILLAQALIQLALPLLPAVMPYTADVRLDWRHLGWAAALGYSCR